MTRRVGGLSRADIDDLNEIGWEDALDGDPVAQELIRWVKTRGLSRVEGYRALFRASMQLRDEHKREEQRAEQGPKLRLVTTT